MGTGKLKVEHSSGVTQKVRSSCYDDFYFNSPNITIIAFLGYNLKI
jgi:hypothetical protein